MGHRMEAEVGVNNNLGRSASDEFVYDLYAVCNHFGSLQGGHYTGKPRSSVSLQRLVAVCWATGTASDLYTPTIPNLIRRETVGGPNTFKKCASKAKLL